MILCVILLWPFKIKNSLILMQNVFNVWVFEDKLVEKLVFGRPGLNTSVFEKLLISYSCISFINQCALRSFCIKCFVFQKFDFSRFLIDRTCCLTDRKCDKNFGYNLPGSIGAGLIDYFLTDRKLASEFFKRFFSHVFFTLFKSFQKLFPFPCSTDPI